MMKHKDIDRLFQEKMKDLEINPNPKVWESIEGKLGKKKRRFVPFWLYGGVAAILIMGLFIFPLFEDAPLEPKIQDSPVITTAPKEEIRIKSDSDTHSIQPIVEEEIVIANNKTQLTQLTAMPHPSRILIHVSSMFVGA